MTWYYFTLVAPEALTKVLNRMEQQEAELANEVRQSEVALEAVNRQHLQELEQRDLQLARMRGTTTAIQDAATRRSGSNRS